MKILQHLWLSSIAFILMAVSVSPALAAQFTLTPRASVSEEYTDNVFLTDTAKEHDWLTRTSVGFTAGLLEKRYGLSLSYDPEYVNYARSSYTNSWRHAANFNAWSDLTQSSRLEITDNLLKTEDPLPELDVASIRTGATAGTVDPSIRRTRNPYLRNTANANFIHNYAERSNFNIAYTYSILRNDKDARQQGIQDNDLHNASAGIEHWFTSRWGADAGLSDEWVDYETSDDQNRILGEVGIRHAFNRHLVGFVRYSHSVVNYEGETEDDKIYNPSAGIEYDVEDDISLYLEGGYFINDFTLREDESGFTLNSLLTKRFQRGSVSLSALGGYDYSFGSAEDLGLQKFAEGGVSGSYRFTRRVSGNLFASYRYSDYLDTFPRREDKIIRGGAGLSIQPLEWMTLGLNYIGRSVDSTTVVDYVEHRGILSVTIAPAVPYRW